MADLCCTYHFAGLTINDPDIDGLILGEDGIVGLDGRPIRSQVDPKGQTDGGIVHPKFYGPRIITFTGLLNIVTVTDRESTLYFAAQMVVEAAVISALESKLNTADNLTWTPTGGSGKSISCTYGTPDGEIKFAGTMLQKTWSFSLIAANPAIT